MRLPWSGEECSSLRQERGLSEAQARQVEQKVPCFGQRPVTPFVASVFSVEAEVRLCLGKRKQWQKRL